MHHFYTLLAIDLEDERPVRDIERRGRIHGFHDQDWAAAEAIARERLLAQPA